jgi:Zn-dependent M16 (insulinase) family peptidase
MKQVNDPNNPGIKEGDIIGDHVVEQVAELPHIHSVFYRLTHRSTGAQHAHISNGDSENTFSVAFKTVPRDSTGVAHILEHTVLCGSRNYPVRDPFFSMIKRSLSTFMNAFTASDWTMYPFSTQNRKDFYNLMDVYLDAAFYPRLDRLSFRQEGHRLETEPAEGEDFHLVYKGVVYNEMKGAMSSPDQVMGRGLMSALYPDTTYGNNSGGDPAVIPTLTWEGLRHFHQIHYHPSNAFFYTYGDLPLETHLSVIQEKVLGHFSRIDPGTVVPPQPRFQEPKTVTVAYPLAENESPEKKNQICLAWLTADIHDAFEVLALELMEGILLGNAAAPLRKALIDSGLGSSLSDGTGFVPDHRDTMFAAGLKDVALSDNDRIGEIVLDTLKELAEKGIDPRLIESAIHQTEFHRKEITNTPYPYGLKLFLSFCGPWFHDADPVRALRFDQDIREIRAALEAGFFFEERIRTHFLENPHRVRFQLTPDQTMERRENERVQAELDRIKAGLAPEEVRGIEADSEALEALQSGEEDLSSLPTLALSDIPADVPSVTETAVYDEMNATLYEQPTSGIFYFTAAAGAGGLERRLLPLVPFFCYALTRIGTARRDYTDMAQEIATYTGGLGVSAHSRTRFDADGSPLPFVTFNGKCLSRNVEKMFSLIRELACEYDLADLKRLKSLLMEFRAGLESMVVRNGHRLAIGLSARNFSPTHALNEIWNGVHQLKTIKEIAEDLSKTRLEAASADLVAIGRQLFTRNNLRIALIGEADVLQPSVNAAAALLEGLEAGGEAGFRPPDVAVGAGLPREGWSTSTAVSFVAKTLEAVRMDHRDAPALAVIGKLLRSLYIHREIREKGGAYGGFSIYNPEDGLFSFGSYRDPHIVNTLAVYEGAAGFIRSGRFADEDVKEAILQVCSDIDKPDPPGPASRKAFYRTLLALSDGERQRYKERLLALTREAVTAVADRYFSPEREAAVAVISGAEKLQAANRKMADAPLSVAAI